jgi:sigma-B regulation protein RsbU (phosphoserine phosphatase)
VLGVRRGSEYAVRETTLRPGDLLVACSDGATEAVSAAGGRFGEERVAALLEGDPFPDAAAAVDSVREAIRRWSGSTPVHDDLTLVGLELRMPGVDPPTAGRARAP